MPADFQKAIDCTIIGLNNTFCFLDDILIVSKGSEEDHFILVVNCIKKLHADNFRINLPKCHFAKQEISWLGYNITQSGTSPLETTTSKNHLTHFKSNVHFLVQFITLVNLFQIWLNFAIL